MERMNDGMDGGMNDGVNDGLDKCKKDEGMEGWMDRWM